MDLPEERAQMDFACLYQQGSSAATISAQGIVDEIAREVITSK